MAKAEEVVESKSGIIGDRSCRVLKATVGSVTFKPDELGDLWKTLSRTTLVQLSYSQTSSLSASMLFHSYPEKVNRLDGRAEIRMPASFHSCDTGVPRITGLIIVWKLDHSKEYHTIKYPDQKGDPWGWG